jgi:rusticyanin
MTRNRISVLAGAAVLAAAGLGTGVAIAACGSPGQPAPLASPPAAASRAVPAAAGSPAAYAGPGYNWYRSMMSGYYGGTMMGGGSSDGWMMSQAGYQWMTGGAGAPGWMRGSTLPAGMMGTGGTDPGTVMGTLFASAPGPRVSPAAARQLGGQVPAGASIDRAARTITFTTTNVSFVVLASPSMAAESFRIAGMTDPSVSVPAGAHVTIELINADDDMAHGLVIMPAGAARSYLPMMTAAPAFTGSALWFLGKPATAGMHAGTLAFTATTPGSYQYLCPVPGHAAEGMTGTFTVR